MAENRGPAAPRGLGRAGRALWRAETAKYEFDPHELVVLAELCRVKDRLEDLNVAIAEVGVSDADGKVPQVVREAREQAVTAARLAAALRFPQGTAGDQQKGARGSGRKAGARGFYGIRGGLG